MKADEINNDRIESWNDYFNGFKLVLDNGRFEIPTVPEGCIHNAHMFYIKTRDIQDRTAFITWMKEGNIGCVLCSTSFGSCRL